MTKKIIFALLVIGFLTSCANKKNILYLQNLDITKDIEIQPKYENRLQPDDILSITVSSPDNQGVAPFNLASASSMVGQESSVGRPRLLNYIIRKDGSIEFPILGKLYLADKTILEAIDFLKVELKPYINEPIVIIEWVNFKFSVLGEVLKPGNYTSLSERVSILDALAMASDLSIYGNRKNIMLIRENNGKRETHIIDITNSDFLQSDVYFLKQNDVIIVSPNNAQVQSSAFNRNAGIYISFASIILALTNIFLIKR